MKIKETIIKAFSLGTGVAVGMILIAKICYEMSHDTCYTDYGQIPGAVASGFKQYVPGVRTATRTTFIWESDRFIYEDKIS